jgi:hypothetical protein
MHSHLAALNRKHTALDQKIRQEMARPVFDTGRIKYYKLEKLNIKREITRLSREETQH